MVARPLSGRRRALWFIALSVGWAAMALVVTLIGPLPGALGTGPLKPGSGNAGIVSHLALGAVVTGSLLCVLHSTVRARRNLLVGSGLVVLGGIALLSGTEALQLLTESRKAALDDGLTNVAGAVLVAIVLIPAFAFSPPSRARTTATVFGVGATILLIATSIAVVAPGRDRSSGTAANPIVPSTPDTDRCLAEMISIPPSARSQPKTDPGVAVPPPILRVDLPGDGSVRTSGPLSALELDINGGVDLDSGGGAAFSGRDEALTTRDPATELIEHLASGTSFTVDAWFKLNDLEQGGPTRLVSLSSGTGVFQTNLHLGVHDGQLSVRLRTACQPRLWVTAGSLSTEPTHAAVTFDEGEVTIYLDGQPVSELRLVRPAIDGWRQDLPLVIGNVGSLNRGFRGTIRSVSLRDTAVDADGVASIAADAGARAALLQS